MRSLRLEYLVAQEGWGSFSIYHFPLVISHLSEPQQLEDHAMTNGIWKMNTPFLTCEFKQPEWSRAK